MRRFLIPLALAFLAFCFAGSALAADEAATVQQFNERLDAARATLDNVETALGDPSLNDATLHSLRARVDALPTELQDVIDRLTPRLSGLQARLDELSGAAKSQPVAKPAPEAKPAPAEPPPAKREDIAPRPNKGVRGPINGKVIAASAVAEAKPIAEPPVAGDSLATASVNAEWAEQKKLYDEVDATLKRARALALEVKETALTIRARQRALFARALFMQTSGFFSPALWGSALQELPYDAKIFAMLVEERGRAVSARLRDGQFASFLAVAFVILLLVAAASLLARRVAARAAQAPEPSPFRQASGGLWAAITLAAIPIAAVSALAVALDGFDLSDPVLAPLGQRLAEAVSFVAVSNGLARGLLAPGLPQWRLLRIGDRLARRHLILAVLVGAVAAGTRVLEQIAELVQAGLPVVVLTRGAGALLIAVVFLIVVVATRHENTAEDPGAPQDSRDWSYALRLLAWTEIVVIVGALAAGYVAFANFLLLQMAWLAAVGAGLYLLLAFVETGAAQVFQPTTLLGRTLVAGFGASPQSLGPFAVLVTGVATLALYAFALFVALVPYGFQSNDFFGNLKSAYSGFKVGEVVVSPAGMATALALFALAYGATRALQRWLDQRFLPLTRLDKGLRHSIGASVGYAGFIFAVAVALSELGLGLERLAIVAGALSVGIGFGLQSIVNNFVSGLILLWERAIRVGDWIVVGDEQGYVKRINVRSTEIETFDRATMIVPNSNLVSGVVKNWLRNDRIGRIKIPLAPHAGVDPEEIRAILFAAAKAHEGVLRIPAPSVMLLGMEQTAFRFELWCYVEDVEQATRIKSDLHFDIHRRLKEAGVTVAAPAAPAPPPTVVTFAGFEHLATPRLETAQDSERGYAPMRQSV
ncbi:MAG TPA: mechanosensitive ion channel domain-containing protein [Methylosinus sp.]